MKSVTARLLCLTLFAAHPVGPQEPASQAFGEHLSVNLVTVEVMVEDRKGSPIEGLAADEFQVSENGRPVEIQHFREVAGRISTAALVPPPDDVPVSEERPASQPLRAEPPLHVVIYVDDANLHPLNRRKVLPHLKTYLHRLPEHARVMVVRAYRSAEVALPFTASHHQAADALDGLLDRFGGRGQVAAGRQDLLNDLYGERSEGLLRSEVFSYAESLHHDLGVTVRTLSGVIDELSGLPGRKALLYVSDGVSIRPGEDLFEVLEEQFDDSVSRMRADDYDLSRDFLGLSRKAASARIILSSVDASGLRVPSNADVAAYRAGRSSAADSIYLSNLQAPLEMMARETGGRAIVNTNLMGDGLRAMANSLSHYYELAYTSPRSGSGRFRDIKVTVRPRSGEAVRARYRRGYRDLDSRQQIEAAVHAALSFGYADNPMGLDLTSSGVDRTGNTSQASITIALPLAMLTLIPNGETTSGRVTVFVGARDADGRFSPVERFQHPITIPQSALEQSPDAVYKLVHTVGVRPGRQSLAIAVRDDLSSQHSIVLGAIDA